MSVSNRGFFRKSSALKDQKPADFAEDMGNRKTFLDTRVPPDNVGNKIEHINSVPFLHDGAGNSLDEDPSHIKSGILTHLSEDGRNANRFRNRFHQQKKQYSLHTQGNSPEMSRQALRSNNQADNYESAPEAKPSTAVKTDPNEYMESLVAEFAKLLKSRAGLPFAFSMKPLTDTGFNEKSELMGLKAIKQLLFSILEKSQLEATVMLVRYRTNLHRFAVFFVNPHERDPAKNKDLISALRQIIKIHITKSPVGDTNILLVLANAQGVIEGHMAKIGAEKLDQIQ